MTAEPLRQPAGVASALSASCLSAPPDAIQARGLTSADSAHPNLEIAIDHDIRLRRLLGDDLVLDRENLIDHGRVDVAVADTPAFPGVLVRRLEEDSRVNASQSEHVRSLHDQRRETGEVQAS